MPATLPAAPAPSPPSACAVCVERESVLFIGTQFSILYTFVYLPA
jgi:hypothetical protein